MSVTIALDAMGGDYAPLAAIEGAARALAKNEDIHFRIFGDEHQIIPLLDKHVLLRKKSTFVHTPEWVKDDDKPATALRGLKQSSMRLAIGAVQDGTAQCALSSGNTGALMALSKIMLKTMAEIDRPAIVSFFPTLKGFSVMLDLGANVHTTAENLVQFAVMGRLFASHALGVENPSIGLLNIGSEEMKGHEILQAAHQSLKDMDENYYGFIEGNDIAKGTVDVVVTDGFTGNVALKTAEGTAHLYSQFLRESFESSWMAKLGYFMMAGALKKLKKRVDPRRYNGALLIGLNGLVLKSHGGSDAVGVANAIKIAYTMAKSNMNQALERQIIGI